MTYYRIDRRRPRVALVGSPYKEQTRPTLERLRRWLDNRAEIVYAEVVDTSVPAIQSQPDLLFVLGGDGTLIGAVHDLGDNQVPIVGVNLGKLGFLADFTCEGLEQSGDFLFSGQVQITRRLMLHAQLDSGDPPFQTPVVNDCVVLAGPPFRIVQMHVEADQDRVAEIHGDGLIIATPSGSTAHNLSAGGPILEPTAGAMVLTPICPHALTFRPLMIDAARRVTVTMGEVNEGTSLSVDGRAVRPLREGDRVTVQRYGADFLLVRNPRQSIWHTLRKKLMWGERPKNHLA